MAIPFKKRAPALEYVSPKQLVLEGFETPFEMILNPNNLSSILCTN